MMLILKIMINDINDVNSKIMINDVNSNNFD